MVKDDPFPGLSKIPCCVACKEDGPSEWVRSQNGCCCFHTEMQPLPEEWGRPEANPFPEELARKGPRK